MGMDPRTTRPAHFSTIISSQRVSAPFASLYATASSNQSQVSELLHGQIFDVYGIEDRFSFGQVRPLVPVSDRPGYVGWVETAALSAFSRSETHRISVITAPMFSAPDLKSPITRSLPLGARLSLEPVSDAFARTSAGDFVSDRHAVPIDVIDNNIVTAARRYLGQPYIWGGTGGRGVDCSGLVQMACAACGIDAPRDADMQEAALGSPVPAPGLAGDFLFWKGHVGLLGSERTLIHANAYHMSTVEEPLDAALKRFENNELTLRTVRRL